MFSEDGGVGTVSSSVRRTRSRRGVFFRVLWLFRVSCLVRDDSGVAAVLARRGAAARLAGFRPRLRFIAAGRRGLLAVFEAARALRRGVAFFVGRLAERFGAARFLVRSAALTRRLALRLAMALVLSEP
jgi:hypothetical protein